MHLKTTTHGRGDIRIAMVHGLGDPGATWQPLIERLAATDRYTVITLDLRGHGLSERAHSYRLDEFADGVVDALPTGLDSVIGHSPGRAVLIRAVDRLRPRHAAYLDPGFHLDLPTSELVGRLFWSVLSMGAAGLLQARRGARTRAGSAVLRSGR